MSDAARQTAEAPDPAEPTMSAADKKARADTFNWFHSIDLGDGVITKGAKDAERLAFEAGRVFQHGVRGLSVLDVGCWDGYFTFEARRRGARRAVGADHYVWSEKSWGDRAAFEFAREIIDPAVEVKTIDLPDMSQGTCGTFDVVLFLGILHHMTEPLWAIRRAAALTEKMMVVETHIDPQLPPEPPALAFYPFDEMVDPGVWFGPNVAGVAALLRAAGFTRIEADETYQSAGGSRCLVHAFR